MEDEDGMCISMDYDSYEYEVDLELLEQARSASEALDDEEDELSESKQEFPSTQQSQSPEKTNNHSNELIVPPPSKAPRGSIQDSFDGHMKHITDENAHSISGSFNEFITEITKAQSDGDIPIHDINEMEIIKSLSNHISPKSKLEILEIVDDGKRMNYSDGYQLNPQYSIKSDLSTNVSSIKTSRSTESDNVISPAFNDSEYLEVHARYSHTNQISNEMRIIKKLDMNVSKFANDGESNKNLTKTNKDVRENEKLFDHPSVDALRKKSLV